MLFLCVRECCLSLGWWSKLVAGDAPRTNGTNIREAYYAIEPQRIENN